MTGWQRLIGCLLWGICNMDKSVLSHKGETKNGRKCMWRGNETQKIASMNDERTRLNHVCHDWCGCGCGFVCADIWIDTNSTRERMNEGCSVLQCVAVCCSVLQVVAVCCSVLQCVAEEEWGMQCAAVCCNMLQCVAGCCCVLQCVAVCCVQTYV